MTHMDFGACSCLLYHIVKESNKSIRNRYLENNCNYGRYGFWSLQLSPLYHLENGSKESIRNRYSENCNYGTMDFGACS